MEWYYIAGIAVVVVIALALILRARSGGQEEQSAPVPAQAAEAPAAGAAPVQTGNDEAVAAVQNFIFCCAGLTVSAPSGVINTISAGPSSL